MNCGMKQGFSYFDRKQDTQSYIEIHDVTVRQTAQLGLSYSTVMTVLFLDAYEVTPKTCSNSRGMGITWTMTRLIGPYSDGMGLAPLQTLVMTELSL
jgi:hypothetical protein